LISAETIIVPDIDLSDKYSIFSSYLHEIQESVKQNIIYSRAVRNTQKKVILLTDNKPKP